MAKRPVAQIAGQDHCFVEQEGSMNDLQLGPGGLTVEQGNPDGGSAQNDQERAIKGGR